MRIAQVKRSVERLVNLGQYENVRLVAEALVILGPNDSVDEAVEQAYTTASVAVKDRLARAIGDVGGKQRVPGKR